jgi:hypothetical protein
VESHGNITAQAHVGRHLNHHLRTLESIDTSLLDGSMLNYFWMNTSG